jgi:hypothetical protein
MLDECGHEFGAGVDAPDRETAREELREMYPENRGILQIESPDEAAERERRLYARICAEYDDGRPDYDDDY